MNERNNQSPMYVFFLLCFAVAFLLIAFFYPSFLQLNFLLGGLAFSMLLVFCFLKIEWMVLTLIFFLPALGGLESYQIDISPFLQFIGMSQKYQIDLFLLSRIFIFFIAGIEIIRRGFSVFKTPLFFALAFSAVLSIPSFIFSEYKIFGLAYYWFFLVSAFGAYFLGYFLFGTKKGYLKIIFATLLSTIIPILVGIKQIALGEFFMSSDTTLPRLQTVFDHPNKFASYLFVILGVYLISYLTIQINKSAARNRSLSLLPFIVLGLFFLLSFSRASWIIFALMVFIIAILKKEIRFPAIYLGSLLVFLSLFIGKVRERILGIFVRQYGDTLSGRMETWDMAWFEFKKNIWTGYGPGSFKEVLKITSGTDIGNFYPHSDAVLFLLEGGILGLFSYLIYILFALYYSFTSYWHYPKGLEKIQFFQRELTVDFKLLGFIPFLLFLVMIPYSFAETPALDFMYQFYAWVLLGSWLGLANKNKQLNS